MKIMSPRTGARLTFVEIRVGKLAPHFFYDLNVIEVGRTLQMERFKYLGE